MGDIGAGLGGGHGWHREPERYPLFKRCELPEFDPLAEGGLADEQTREQRFGVHVGVGEEPEFFELGVVEEVGLVNLCGCPHNSIYVDLAVIRTLGWPRRARAVVGGVDRGGCWW